MPEIADLLTANDPRLEVLRPGPTADDARVVMLWVQRAQRATHNLAANHAIALGDRLGVPVVAVFCLVPAFPRATLRSYRFMAEGLAELPEAFAKRGLGWCLRIGDPESVIPALARELRAAAVVTDQNPLAIGRGWRSGVAGELRIPMVAVDADVVVPTALLPKEEWAPRTIRPKLAPHLDRFLVPTPNPSAQHRSAHRDGPDPLAAIRDFSLDGAVAPNPALRGGTKEAETRLRRFVRERLAAYDADRDRPDVDGSSRLSPYLHYGQIEPIRIALAARDAGNDGAPHAAVASFLDELITQRELAINFCLRNPAYDRFAGLPVWGRKTLAEHAADPRPAISTEAQLDAAETADPLWNAAQKQMVADGWLPNRLRMYWGKQFLRWTPNPEAAHAALLALNDRYFLDGRDAVGYAQIAWTIGGRHDRPFPPNKPILGLVRPMALSGMKKRFDVAAYIAAVEARLG